MVAYGFTLKTKDMKRFFTEIFQDEKGGFSSKRFVGIMAALTLCITMYHNQFTESHIAPADSLVNAVAALAFGALGLASADKIFKKKDCNCDKGGVE